MKKDNINLIQGDCMDVMRDYPDNYFDLAIVDPPYREMKDNQPTRDMRSNGSMANFGDKPNFKYFNELFRVSKNQIIWGANNFSLPNYKGFVIWKKKTISENFTMSMCELAFLSEGLATTSKWIEIAPQDPHRIHPTQKPTKLYDFLYKHYAEKEHKIIDTHLGSGSNAIAAYYYGVSEFVGIELDEDYYKAACKRFEEQTRQQKLF